MESRNNLAETNGHIDQNHFEQSLKLDEQYHSHANVPITQRMEQLKQSANFMNEQYQVHNDLRVNVFVNYVKLDQKGQLIEEHQAREQANKSASKKQENISDISEDDYDDEEEEDGTQNHNEEEEKNNESDTEDHEEIQITNKYVVDLIAEFKDKNDDLVLHWGVGKKASGEWTAPDDKYLPIDTKRWSDGKACQTKFQMDNSLPEYRSIHMDFSWIQDMETPLKSMSYVLMEQKKNRWHNNGGKDYHVKFQIEPEQHHEEAAASHNKNMPTGKIGDVVREIIQCEVEYGSWTLMHRYQRCKDMLSQKIDQENRDHVAYLYIWLRFSFTKQLTWQKSYNTKPKDLQWSQVCLTDEIVNQFVQLTKKNSQASRDQFLTSADLLRSMLSMIGKGAGNGQRVRDEILHIMHAHKISETAGHFYEQWHQKLHNNTTPDDIYICEGLLAYLKSGGNMSEYWRVLNQNGITKERLAGYERKITTEPWYKPEAIGSFEAYLQILKEMHSSGDLQILSNEAKQHLGGDTKGMIDDLLGNYNDHDILRQMERVSKLRFNLNQHHLDLNNQRKLKDVLFLDVALEGYLRQLTEKIMHIDIGFEQYIREAAIIMSNLSLSYKWEELGVVKEDWDFLVQSNSKNMNEDNARKLKSVVDRVKSSLGEVNDQYMNLIQTKAEMLGQAFNLEPYAYKIFAEELIRGTLFFSLSMILKKIDPHIRSCAHVGDWLIISQGRSHGSRGYVEKVKHLTEVMHHNYERRTILLCEKITGEEEVPANVQALVLVDSTDYPDVLAHVSVRARNLKVMFTVAFADNHINELNSMVGKHIFMTSENHNVRFQEQNPNTPITRRASSSLILQSIIDSAKNIPVPPDFPRSFLQLDEFNKYNMGAKSNNIKVLKDNLDKWIELPQSGCIPFKMMEYTLGLHPQIKEQIDKLIDRLVKVKNVDKMNRILFKCKDLVMKLDFSPQDDNHSYMKTQLIEFGIPAKEFELAWKTIKMVWASKFNERAFLATKKIGVTLHSVYMAVLVQKVVPAEYAYVIHTTNPTNGEDNEVYIESCLGMGEALVSQMPGQAFSFTFNKSTQQPAVNAYPNKPIGLKANGFIFRSDSNSEDLPGFAGAGLFDSYPMLGTTEFRIKYHDEKLITDKQFRENFMRNVGKIGEIIENIYGEAQDIEGAYFNNKFHVVQTRPQV